MLSLAEHQHAMVDLLKGRDRPRAEDACLARLDGSKELELLREVAVFWRVLALELGCPWMVQLLKRRGELDGRVTAFYRSENVSPYAGKATEQFILGLRNDPDPLIAATARTEWAMIRVRQGDTGAFVVDWDRNADLVFLSLGSGNDLPPPEDDVRYRLHIARDLPRLLRCERLAWPPS